MADNAGPRRGAAGRNTTSSPRQGIQRQGTRAGSPRNVKSGKAAEAVPADSTRTRPSTELPKLPDKNDLGSSSAKRDGDVDTEEHAKDRAKEHAQDASKYHGPSIVAARREPKPSSLLIQSLTSKWSRFTQLMVVKLIEGGEDVKSKLPEPWDPGFEEYGQTVGATALHFASRRGLLEVVKSLLEHKAEVNAATDTGATPIMVASMFSQIQAAKLLFEAQASVLMRDQHGFCAMDLAILEGKLEVVEAVQEMEIEEERKRELAVQVEDDHDEEEDEDDLFQEHENFTKRSSAQLLNSRSAHVVPRSRAGSQIGGPQSPRKTAMVRASLLAKAFAKGGGGGVGGAGGEGGETSPKAHGTDAKPSFLESPTKPVESSFGLPPRKSMSPSKSADSTTRESFEMPAVPIEEDEGRPSDELIMKAKERITLEGASNDQQEPV